MFYNVRTGCDRKTMIAARFVFGGKRRFLDVVVMRDRGDEALIEGIAPLQLMATSKRRN